VLFSAGLDDLRHGSVFVAVVRVMRLFLSVFRGFRQTHGRAGRCVAFVLLRSGASGGSVVSRGSQGPDLSNTSRRSGRVNVVCLAGFSVPLLVRQDGDTGRKLASWQGTDASALLSGMSAGRLLARKGSAVDVRVGRVSAEF
jgi:hypothetical protein